MKYIVAFVCALFVLGVSSAGWLMFQLNRPPAELGRVRQLKPGMSQDEVRAILGTPRVFSIIATVGFMAEWRVGPT
jgi:outer membrane protein assembly factor BamE (lipoprotein component of BamABCDE complex)